jgi:hypothetical protein
MRARTRGAKVASTSAGKATNAVGSNSINDAPRDCNGTPSLQETSAVGKEETGYMGRTARQRARALLHVRLARQIARERAEVNARAEG